MISSMTKKSKLEIRNLFKSYSLSILQNISLYVAKNEIISIIGPSGCGKSTLLDCISGVTGYDSGKITFDNSTKTGMSYMMQDDALLPWRTIFGNITLPLEISGAKTKSATEDLEKLLLRFGLSQFATFYPFALSAGMRQRVAFLRAYAAKRDIMLMDEPFGKLDALTRLHMQQWFLEIWRKHKLTVILVTHDIDEALLLSDRIYIFSPRPARVVKVFAMRHPRKSDREHEVIKRQILRLLK